MDLDPLPPAFVAELDRQSRTCDRQSDECSGDVTERGTRPTEYGAGPPPGRVIVRLCEFHAG